MAQHDDHPDIKAMAAKLKGYHAAIASEFSAIEAQDQDAILDSVRKKFAASMIVLADEVVTLARNAESEATKLNAVKFAFEFYFGKETGKDSDFSQLLKSLQEAPVE